MTLDLGGPFLWDVPQDLVGDLETQLRREVPHWILGYLQDDWRSLQSSLRSHHVF